VVSIAALAPNGTSADCAARERHQKALDFVCIHGIGRALEICTNIAGQISAAFSSG